jgi:hypothetical protein
MAWAICGQDCSQVPEVGNGTKLSSDPACFRAQTSSRRCWRELCPFNPAAECAHRLKLSLPLFKAKKWNNLWKEDIINAVAKTLKVKL